VSVQTLPVAPRHVDERTSASRLAFDQDDPVRDGCAGAG
jgi:hypothetical protein